MQPLIVSFLTFLLMANDSTSGARFTVRELPYAYDALAPQLSEETLRYHHDKHYAGYVAKLNELILDTPYEGSRSRTSSLRPTAPSTTTPRRPGITPSTLNSSRPIRSACRRERLPTPSSARSDRSTRSASG